MVRMVNSTDDFSMKEAWMHFKLAGRMWTTYGYLNPGESLNRRTCTNLRFPYYRQHTDGHACQTPAELSSLVPYVIIAKLWLTLAQCHP